MSLTKLAFVGVIASPISLSDLTISLAYLTVENGKITRKGTKKEFASLQESGALKDFKIIHLTESQFLLPGLVDCHLHAPQFPNIGLGLDRPLLEWLDKYTFPLEKNYSDVQFAKSVYDQVVKRLVKNGTTTACYFGTIDLNGTLELVNSVMKYGQRALVGKVSMNIENNAGYYNKTEKELIDVEKFITVVLSKKNDLVMPAITPRFALSCDAELMKGLAHLSEKYGIVIQTHISENLKEIEHVLKINPDCKSYADVYNQSRLLTERTILAHAVHLTDDETALLAAKQVAVAHCPASNTRLKSGLCLVRRLLDNNITVGLGTDVSGGDNASILDAIRRCMDVSTHLELEGKSGAAVDWKQALCLATLGGAKAMSLDKKIGSFEVGKEFDALLVDLYPNDSAIDQYSYTVDRTCEERAVSLVQRFVYLGDDRNIHQVYVKGRRIHSRCSIKKIIHDICEF